MRASRDCSAGLSRPARRAMRSTATPPLTAIAAPPVATTASVAPRPIPASATETRSTSSPAA